MTRLQLLDGLASTRGDEVALTDDRGHETFAELAERATRLADALRKAGLAAGDTIALVAGNQREYFELMLACSHLGITYVPVNWHWVAEEVAYVLRDAEVRGVVVDQRYTDVVSQALEVPGVPHLQVGVEIGPGSSSSDALVGYEAFLATGDVVAPTVPLLGGPMFYTSGTTGKPKGVRSALTGATDTPTEVLALVAAGVGELLPPGGRTLLCGPIYHSAQWAFSFLPFVNGLPVVMQHKFDAAGVLELIDRHRITNLHLVPTQMQRLLALPDDVRAAFDGSSLHAVWHGAAPCPPDVKQRMIEWWGPRIWEYYGSTEGAIISTISSEDWLRKGGSVGRPGATTEVVVVGDDGTRLGPGEDGALYFRNSLGMDFEYHGEPTKTADAHLEPGLFTTGDVGHLDDEGYLWLSDRKIDMIISGGVNIYPAEIEGILAAHPAVADVAVIGVPDDEWGESVHAAIELAEGSEDGSSLEDELVALSRAHLAGYKRPRSFEYVAEIPRTPTGKIKKEILRAPYWGSRDRRR
ncbi:MAG: AMP-binding protein [Actinobacteria bacterium]|nr:AMP-binding protein [Actinomycetota bacterium]